VTDAGLKELAGLKNLQSLNLDFTPVSDAGLRDLAGLQSLQHLSVMGTKVSDAGLKELAGLKNLQSLNLFFTPVTKTGVQELQKALPKCKISVAPSDAGTGGKAHDRIQGTWVLTRWELNPKEAKDAPKTPPVITWIFQGEKVKNVEKAKTVSESTFKLDPTQSPAQIDIVITAVAENDKQLVGKTTKGIYIFEGETLKLCLGETGGDRPAKFSTEGKGYRILYLTRPK
jgi:uncharacterized protein (TIGR03067 family)